MGEARRGFHRLSGRLFTTNPQMLHLLTPNANKGRMYYAAILALLFVAMVAVATIVTSYEEADTVLEQNDEEKELHDEAAKLAQSFFRHPVKHDRYKEDLKHFEQSLQTSQSAADEADAKSYAQSQMHTEQQTDQAVSKLNAAARLAQQEAENQRLQRAAEAEKLEAEKKMAEKKAAADKKATIVAAVEKMEAEKKAAEKLAVAKQAAEEQAAEKAAADKKFAAQQMAAEKQAATK